jgi:hypothetical protein
MRTPSGAPKSSILPSKSQSKLAEQTQPIKVMASFIRLPIWDFGLTIDPGYLLDGFRLKQG